MIFCLRENDMQVLELVQTGPVRMWISGKIITRVDISMSLCEHEYWTQADSCKIILIGH